MSDWLSEAACHGKVDVMFPRSRNNGRRGGGFDYRPAEALCAGCPVLADCLADLDTDPELAEHTHGFRAGMTPDQRIRRRKRQPSGSVADEMASMLVRLTAAVAREVWAA